VLSKHPRYGQALAVRAQLALLEGDYAGGEQFCKRSLDNAPMNYQVLYDLYRCLQSQGKDAEAKETFAKLNKVEKEVKRLNEIVSIELGKDPNNPDLHYELATLYFRLGNESEAVHWLERTLKVDPQYGPAQNGLAEYYSRVGRPEKAAKYHQS